MNRCRVESINKNGEIEFLFFDTIDESLANYLEIFPLVPKMNINLENVQSINSTGIREWIKLMAKLKDSKIKIYNAPKSFIDQVNMVNGFLPLNTTLQSFYVPYFSESTNKEKKVLFVRDKHFGDNFVNVTDVITDEAGQSYELDILPKKYFKFINL
jgi:hypothetical protein